NAQRTGVTATAAAGSGGYGGLYQVSLGMAQLAGKGNNCGPLTPVVMELPISNDQTSMDVAGIVGLDFLSRFDIAIDFERGEMALGPPGTASTGAFGTKDLAKIDGEMMIPPGFFAVKLLMESCGKPVSAVVDLGSAFTVLNTPAANLIGARPETLRNTGQVVAGAAAPGKAYTPVQVLEGNFSIGFDACSSDKRLKDHLCSVGDLPGFAALGRGNEAMVVLGSDVLKAGGRFVLSVYSRAMWLALP
ncbi:unnamed protein product, partial [Chrysoparadoxa australica]